MREVGAWSTYGPGTLGLGAGGACKYYLKFNGLLGVLGLENGPLTAP